LPNPASNLLKEQPHPTANSYIPNSVWDCGGAKFCFLSIIWRDGLWDHPCRSYFAYEYPYAKNNGTAVL